MFSFHFPLAPALSASYVALVTAVTSVYGWSGGYAQTDATLSLAVIFQYLTNSVAVAVAVGAFGFLWRTNGDLREINAKLGNLVGTMEENSSDVKGLVGRLENIVIEQTRHAEKLLTHADQIKALERRKSTRRHDDLPPYSDDG